MATAVLSVAQRMSDMEHRASVRVRGVEGLARRALEEARREVRERGREGGKEIGVGEMRGGAHPLLLFYRSRHT